MSRKYFCLVAGFPDIFLDETKYSSTLLEFKEYLEQELHPDDFGLIRLIYLSYDNKNLLDYLIHDTEDFNPLGNYTLEDVKEQMYWLDDIPGVEGGELPPYMVSFIRNFKSDESGKTYTDWEKYITELYYKHLLETKNDFIANWFRFELNLKNILTAVNCRKHNIEIEKQLVTENEVATILARNHGADFGLSIEIEDIDYIIKVAETENLLERENLIDLYKWNYLDEHTFFHYFTIERVFAYQLKLIMVFRWMGLDKETGEAMFRSLIKEMKESYEFPEEFKI
ncbi:MAG: DUF2764 family protein [Bacteroidota bacterium]